MQTRFIWASTTISTAQFLLLLHNVSIIVSVFCLVTADQVIQNKGAISGLTFELGLGFEFFLIRAFFEIIFLGSDLK